MSDENRGQARLFDALTTKGTAFTVDERRRFGLLGLLPAAVNSLSRNGWLYPHIRAARICIVSLVTMAKEARTFAYHHQSNPMDAQNYSRIPGPLVATPILAGGTMSDSDPAVLQEKSVFLAAGRN